MENNLPKELQDMIGEYNVNHRPMFAQVMNQLERNVIFCKQCGAKFCKRNKNDSMCSNSCRYQYVSGWIGLAYSN